MSFGRITNIPSTSMKVIEVLSEGKAFWIKTPKMIAPFGASDYDGDGKYQIQLNLPDDGVFSGKMSLMDEWIMNQMSLPNNTVDYLGARKEKPYSQEVVESKFSPIVHQSKNSTKYPSKINVKVYPQTESPMMTEFFNADKTEAVVTPTNIKTKIGKQSQLSGLIKPRIWVSSKGFGISLTGIQFMIHTSGGHVKRDCFVDPKEGDN